jgi:hypothetical protein
MSAHASRRGLDRRAVLALGGAALAAPLLSGGPVAGGEGRERHGLSIFGDLKYPPDFRHFDYVNPAAPKGGTMSYVPSSWAYNQNPNTFNTLNTLILKGDAPVGLTIVFASLMTRAFDEPDAVYGYAARSVSIWSLNLSGTPAELITSSPAPDSERLRTVQSIVECPPLNEMRPASIASRASRL